MRGRAQPVGRTLGLLILSGCRAAELRGAPGSFKLIAHKNVNGKHTCS
jgi:hypothetical protein